MNNQHTDIIDLRGVTKSYPGPAGTVNVLRGIDLAIPEETSISIRGESGCGKTTLLAVLSLLETPDGGALLWKGREAKSLKPRELAAWRNQNMGFIFQAYHLIPELDATENVLVPRRLRGRISASDKERAAELLQAVGLADRAAYTVDKLSGGEKQRVAIARALINRPSLILADEPTGNLDEKTSRSVMDILLQETRNRCTSLLLITHNPDFAREATHPFILSEGRLHPGS